MCTGDFPMVQMGNAVSSKTKADLPEKEKEKEKEKGNLMVTFKIDEKQDSTKPIIPINSPLPHPSTSAATAINNVEFTPGKTRADIARQCVLDSPSAAFCSCTPGKREKEREFPVTPFSQAASSVATPVSNGLLRKITELSSPQLFSKKERFIFFSFSFSFLILIFFVFLFKKYFSNNQPSRETCIL